MEMALRTSNLVLPQGFVEMDREEMMYVDGGLFIGLSLTYAQCMSFCEIAGGLTRAIGGSVLVMSKIASAISAFFAWVNALPVAGQIAFGFIIAASIVIAGHVVAAAIMGKGIYAGLNVTYKPSGFLGLFGKYTAKWEYSFR